MRILPTLLSALLFVATTYASCTCFIPPEQKNLVGAASPELFNKSSKVVITRHRETTVLTMVNDYRGALTEFAMVAPVPVVPLKDEIKVVDIKAIEALEAYSAPHLVETIDRDPCWADRAGLGGGGDFFGAAPGFGGDGAPDGPPPKTFGVTVEASYQVGEYDIQVLSGKESDGLLAWLKQNNYAVPEAAKPVLGSYLKQKMKFIVAKVNLKNQSEAGYSYLRPLQIRYDSPKFTLPIRLGMVNANGDQELFAYLLNPRGRIECSNYKTARIPLAKDIPAYVKDDFGAFYKQVFDTLIAEQKSSTVYTEFAGKIGRFFNAPAATPTVAQLQELGCHWPITMTDFFDDGEATYLTRLHLRYNAKTFPEDLQFQLTGDKTLQPGRYDLRTPVRPSATSCDAYRVYKFTVKGRWNREVTRMHELTREPIADIWKKHAVSYSTNPVDAALYRDIMKLGKTVK